MRETSYARSGPTGAHSDLLGRVAC